LTAPTDDSPERTTAATGSRLKQAVFVTLAIVSLVLGAIGIFLPGLPTTPFLLLACYFSAKSSPRIYRYIRESTLFGPLVHDWQEHRGIRLRTKLQAVGFVILGLAILVATAWDYPIWLSCGLLLGIIGISVVLRLPTI
jgi:uncharacterized membrane protein YbaN (DUF454 family)